MINTVQVIHVNKVFVLIYELSVSIFFIWIINFVTFPLIIEHLKVLYKLVALKTIGKKHIVNYREVFKTENNKNRRFSSKIAQKRNKTKPKCSKFLVLGHWKVVTGCIWQVVNNWRYIFNNYKLSVQENVVVKHGGRKIQVLLHSKM